MIFMKRTPSLRRYHRAILCAGMGGYAFQDACADFRKAVSGQQGAFGKEAQVFL
ncbi:hypothetical protein BACCAP_01569 [Pseudoflavonifractor capillosus ATCC 29799]|uniref:Uncharacterized protein n=1 Tax=Pseudoflavonifractor capillosus ATCC 29799 TaxID=411467 RepID=A6NTP0_9FIRM|nr:hypothetical protein BACCAP_01569 [Pseudoflavonifractor capillosus ATCC 29799]